jgi:hypothetical protein
MKNSRNVLAAFALVAIVGGLAWLLRAPESTGPPVALTLLPNSPTQSVATAVVRIANRDERAILLTDMIVETNSPSGWRAMSHTVPTNQQRLAPGDTKDAVVAMPAGVQTWRLRVTYGKDVKGSLLFLGKAGYAVTHFTWPGKGFGIMAGSNSCVMEISGTDRR